MFARAKRAGPGATLPQGSERRSLIPREHGATMQLVFPLLWAFTLGTPTVAAIAYTIAAILVFVAHEPLLVILGRRGVQQKALLGAQARRWLVLLVGLAVLFGAPSLVLFAEDARALAMVPALLGLATLLLTLRGVRERSLGMELLVSLALTSVAVPVALESGAPVETFTPALVSWLVAFVVGTLAARAVLYRQKDAGRGLRVAQVAGALVLAAGAALALAFPAWWRVWLAPAPFAALALALGTSPPPATRMMVIGFGLMAASGITLWLLVAGAD